MWDEVLDFIKRRFSKENNWLDKNCLWFSLILKNRFPSGRIYYLPISGHFIYKFKGKYYDQTGIVEPVEKMILFNKIKKEDPTWYKKLIRDCYL